MGKGQRRYTPQQVDTVHDLYLTGQSPTQIAAVTGIPWRTIHSWVKKGGWDAVREEITQEAAERRKEELIADRGRVDRVYFGMWNTFLKKLQKHVISQIEGVENMKDRVAVFCTAAFALLRSQRGHNICLGNEKGEAGPTEDETIRELTDQEIIEELDAIRADLDTEEAARGKTSDRAAPRAAKTKSA
jgi:hypothetical protein